MRIAPVVFGCLVFWLSPPLSAGDALPALTLQVPNGAMLTLTRAQVRQVKVEQDEALGSSVRILLMPEPAAWLAAVTRANVGKPIEIKLGPKVISAPIVRAPITGGNFVITVPDRETARTIASALR